MLVHDITQCCFHWFYGLHLRDLVVLEFQLCSRYSLILL